jgi:hypothetical protein
MPLTAAAQTTVFAEHVAQMGIPNAAHVVQVQAEGNASVEDLVDFDKDTTQANQKDKQTIGESRRFCLSPNPAVFLPEPVLAGPDDSFSAPDCPAPAKSDIQFEVSAEAAQNDTGLLGEVDCYVASFLKLQEEGTTLGFRSEFRPAEALRHLQGTWSHSNRPTSAGTLAGLAVLRHFGHLHANVVQKACKFLSAILSFAAQIH